LDQTIAAKKFQLRTLENELTKTRAIINTLKQEVVKAISDAQKNAVNNITQAANASKQEINATAFQSRNSINHITQIGCQSVQTCENKIIKSLDNQNAKLQQTFYNNHVLIKGSLNDSIQDIKKWGDIREQAGNYSDLIQISTILFGINTNPDAILELDLALINRLAERIHNYCLKKLPNSKMKAPEVISRKEFAISASWEVHLSSITWWLVEALREIERGIKT